MKTTSLNLREVKNQSCKKCGRNERHGDNGLCSDVVSQFDSLAVRCVGDWSYDKIYRLVSYFGIFTGGMKLKWGLNYIEICSGPGRCVIREDGREIDGTALAIINHPNCELLQNALFIDNSPEVVETLTKRIDALKASKKASAKIGDYTDSVGLTSLLASLPANRLNLCFLDPTECDVPFTTIKNIAKILGKVDFIINVAIGTDVSRNIANAILEPSFATVRQKYASFLGDETFFDRDDIRAFATLGKFEELRREFINAYVQRLTQLGFPHTDIRPVKHYYYLLFASGNPKGLEFWEKACRYEPDSQKTLF